MKKMDDLVIGEAPALTTQEHLQRADRALEVARQTKKRIDSDYPNGMPSNIGEQSTYLGRHAEYLDLMQIVNVHCNMVTAKTLFAMESCGRFHPGEPCNLGDNHPVIGVSDA
jgi:hypothetical protein